MAVTRIGEQVTNWTATSTPEGTNTVSVDIPLTVINNDVLVVIFNVLSPSFITQQLIDPNPPGMYSSRRSELRISSEDFDELTSYAGVDVGANGLYVFTKHWETGDPTSFDFEIGPYFNDDNEIDFEGFVGKVGQFVVIGYRGNDVNSIVETYLRWWGKSGSGTTAHTFQLPTTKDDSMLMLIGSAVHKDRVSPVTPPVVVNDATFTSVHSHTYSETLLDVRRFIPTDDPDPIGSPLQEYYIGDFEISEFLTTGQGTFPIDFDVTGAHDSNISIVLSLIESGAQTTDPKPTGSGPSITGRGYRAWTEDIVNALEVEIWKPNSVGILAVASSGADAPVCLSGTFNFDSLGNCLGGEAYFLQPPIQVPNEGVLRLKLTSSDVTSEYWYSALMENIERVKANKYKVKLVGLFEVNRYDACGAIPTFPTLTGVYPTKLNLFEGKVIPIAAGTADEQQSWEDLLQRRFDLWPDISYGVGAEFVWSQGRARDGTVRKINYTKNLRRMRMKVDEYSITDYVTSYYYDSGGVLNPADKGSRNDLDVLTPRRVVSTEQDGAGNLIAPIGSQLPFYLERSHVFDVQGLLKPPIQINGIPGIGGQYVAGSSVIVKSRGSSAGNIESKITTGALPYEESL